MASPRSWGRAWPTAAPWTRACIFPPTISIPKSVDPETGAVLPPGEEGELVITTLSTVAFPLVRFRSGDRTRLNPAPCSCGRTLVRLGEIRGRVDDLFSVGGIKVHPEQAGRLLQDLLGGHPPKFRWQVATEAGLEVLDLELTVEEDFFSDEIKAMEGLCREVRRHFHDHLGVPARLTLKEIGVRQVRSALTGARQR